MNLQTSINILQSRDWSLVCKANTCYIYNLDDQYLILPLTSIGRVPSGTLDTMFRSVYTLHEGTAKPGITGAKTTPVLTVILEKQGSQIWARIEQRGLLAIATGDTMETLSKKLNEQLVDFTAYMNAQNRKNKLPADFAFDYYYDLTRVRELFQQFRINALAEQTNISQDLLSQFITSKQHPSSQQAQQIEALIQQFGREMINFSLL